MRASLFAWTKFRNRSPRGHLPKEEVGVLRGACDWADSPGWPMGTVAPLLRLLPRAPEAFCP
jgi:hypothetical protein